MSALRTREEFEREEQERLAPYALKSAESQGRLYPEPLHAYRTAFQRDRDRIVHSRAFRRLDYKTQVFVYREGDHYRNRLTHTLEGSQIARSIARALRLNEELAEAIVLAHDLGHTPFGHAGERVLAQVMKEHGGFDHNRQSLRIVDILEERYAGFRGLNLTYETREGILKHGCHWSHPVAVPEASHQPCLEAQVADVADEIAYTNHDIDDGIRSGLLTLEQFEDVPLWRETLLATRQRVGAISAVSVISEPVLRAQTIGSLIDRLVTDVVETSAAKLDAAGVSSVAAVRQTPGRLVGYSPELEKEKSELKQYLSRQLYHHPQVLSSVERVVKILEELFDLFRADSSRLPESVRGRFEAEGEARAIADYIAGMTDRFAVSEHQRLIENGAR